MVKTKWTLDTLIMDQMEVKNQIKSNGARRVKNQMGTTCIGGGN